MNHLDHSSDSSRGPVLTFSGAAALLLLVAAFCAYPLGAYLPAVIFAGLAFVSLSLSAPTPARVRVRTDTTHRRPDPR